MAYSRWPNRETKNRSWGGVNAEKNYFPEDIQEAIEIILKKCFDPHQSRTEALLIVEEDFFSTF